MLNVVTVATPVLAFVAGVFFSKWMGERRRARRKSSAWYREVRR